MADETNTHEHLNDQQIHDRIHALAEEERQLREHGDHTEEQRARLAHIEHERDQLWDLQRQRDAKRQYGEDPEQAQPRPEPTVENYLQ